MMKIRNVFVKWWQRTRRQDCKAAANRQTKQIRNGINKIRNMNWAAKLSQIEPNNRDLYQTTKFLKKRNKFLPPFKINSDILLTAQEKTDALAAQFESAHQNPLADIHPAFTLKINDEIESFIAAPIPANNTFTEPSIRLIKYLIIKLKNRKAPGKDRINNTFIKNLPPLANKYIHLIISLCMRNSYFPNQWKYAKVIAIHKPGKDPTTPSIYRPISLLSSISKILERVVLYQINDHLDGNNILPKQQFGSRPKFSTVHQLHRIVKQVKTKLKVKESTGMLLMDVEKAFDRVWHNGLIYKMIKYNFPPRIIKFIYSFLNNRKFHVKSPKPK